MTYNDFKRITRRGNFVAWKSDEVTAIAYMTANAWFDIAINCCRDGDMGVKDADGVYFRQWVGDEVWIDDEPRIATKDEVLLYLRKVGLKEAGIEREDGSTPALIIESDTIRGDYNYQPIDFEDEFANFLKEKADVAIHNVVNEFFRLK